MQNWMLIGSIFTLLNRNKIHTSTSSSSDDWSVTKWYAETDPITTYQDVFQNSLGENYNPSKQNDWSTQTARPPDKPWTIRKDGILR